MFTQLPKSWRTLVSCTLALPMLSSCELPATVAAGNSTATVSGTISTNTNTNGDSGNSVCNPLGGGTSLGGVHGLKADLYYLDPNGTHYNNVVDYVRQGTKLDAALYFDQVNVPTRPFDAGFVTNSGSVITTPQGNTLYEWFAIEFQTVLKLAPGDAAGNKQFALIADDGAILEQEVNGQWQTIVDNDGTHASKFVVARAPVFMDSNSNLKLRLRYYQGPRYHIAAIVMWRAWNGSWNDAADGLTGNATFFDSTRSPSVPQSAYNGILARGWAPVPAANYFLDDSAPVNPCPVNTDTGTATSTDTGTATTTDTSTNTTTSTDTSTSTSTSTQTAALSIVGFDGVTTVNSANLIWQTPGAPASGRIYWGTSANQLDRIVDENAGLATVHQVQVTGLTGATQYFFQAESTDAGGNTLKSNVISKVTK